MVLIIALLNIKEKQVLIDNFSFLSWPLLLFNLISIAVGYFVPRLLKVEKSQPVSISMEIGLHNGAFAIYIALNVLQNSTMSIPPAIYSLWMFFTAAIFGYWVNRKNAS